MTPASIVFEMESAKFRSGVLLIFAATVSAKSTIILGSGTDLSSFNLCPNFNLYQVNHASYRILIPVIPLSNRDFFVQKCLPLFIARWQKMAFTKSLLG